MNFASKALIKSNIRGHYGRPPWRCGLIFPILYPSQLAVAWMWLPTAAAVTVPPSCDCDVVPEHPTPLTTPLAQCWSSTRSKPVRWLPSSTSCSPPSIAGNAPSIRANNAFQKWWRALALRAPVLAACHRSTCTTRSICGWHRAPSNPSLSLPG